MAWHDEIIGFGNMLREDQWAAWLVHDVMKNDMMATEEHLRILIGNDWREIFERLRMRGIAKVKRCFGTYRIRIVAPGDGVRERSKNAMRAYRRKGKLT